VGVLVASYLHVRTASRIFRRFLGSCNRGAIISRSYSLHLRREFPCINYKNILKNETKYLRTFLVGVQLSVRKQMAVTFVSN